MTISQPLAQRHFKAGQPLKSVAEKSNEIPAVQQLIEMLDLSGAVVTADALHCQRETAEKVIAKLNGSIRRKRCGWDEATFERLLAGFTGV